MSTVLSHAKALPPAVQKLAILGVSAFATYFLYALATKGFKGVASAVAEGTVRAAGDVAAGAVIGAGKAVGIPETDMQACRDAIASGRTWDASFACPADVFIKSVFGVQPPPEGLSGMTVGDSIKDIWPLLAVGAAAFYLNRKGR